MPVSKSLSKIQKNLKSKGKQVTVHPKGRKFQQLNKATLREGKIAAKKKAHNERKSHELARLKFIQDIINSDSMKDKKTFDGMECAVFIEQFIARDDDELNDLKAKRRSNRPPTNKQLILEAKKNAEVAEFKRGFLCPDLEIEKNVEFLRSWNQTFGALNNMKFVRISDKGDRLLAAKGTTDIEMS